jgi:hypothetical protein
MKSELTDEALELVAKLPDDIEDLSPGQSHALVEFTEKILTAKRKCMDEFAALPDELTAEAVLAVQAIGRAELDADRAVGVLGSWEDRSGFSEKHGLPSHERDEPLVIENPTGGIEYRVPAGDEDES